MSSSKANPAKSDSFLDLPDAPDFISEAPDLTRAEYLKLMEADLPRRNANYDQKLLENSPYMIPFELL